MAKKSQKQKATAASAPKPLRASDVLAVVAREQAKRIREREEREERTRDQTRKAAEALRTYLLAEIPAAAMIPRNKTEFLVPFPRYVDTGRLLGEDDVDTIARQVVDQMNCDGDDDDAEFVYVAGKAKFEYVNGVSELRRDMHFDVCERQEKEEQVCIGHAWPSVSDSDDD